MAHEERVIWAPRLALSPTASIDPEKSAHGKAVQQPAEDESGIRQPYYSQESADPKQINPDQAVDDDMAGATRRHKPKVIETSDPSMQNSECQVPGCGVGLFEKLKRKVRICEKHRHSLKLQMDGFEGRFCQQCSRVHNIDRFDGSRRGCRSRLLRRVQKEREERDTSKHSDDEGNDEEGRRTAEAPRELARAAPSSHHHYGDYYDNRGGDRNYPMTSAEGDKTAAGRAYYDYEQYYRPDMRMDEWSQGQSEGWWSQGHNYNFPPSRREGGAMAPHPYPLHRKRDFRSMATEPAGPVTGPLMPPESGSYYPQPSRRPRASMPPSAAMPLPLDRSFPPAADPYYRNYHSNMAYQSSMGGLPPSRHDRDDRSSSMTGLGPESPSRRSSRTTMDGYPGYMDSQDFARNRQDFPGGGGAQSYSPPRAKKYGHPGPHMCSGPECRTCQAFFYYSH